MKRLLATGFLLFSAFAGAGGFAPGVWAGINASNEQQHNYAIDAQWMQMSKAWTDCVNRGGDVSSCGQPPIQPPAQPQYQAPVQPQYQPQPNYSCLSLCQNGKNAQGQLDCEWQCRR